MDSDGIRKLLAEATPGPWYSEEKPGMKAMGQPSNIGVWSEHKFNAALVSDDEDIDPKDEAWIAGIWGILCDEDRANARLIAAAPDIAAEVLRLSADLAVAREALVEAAALAHKAFVSAKMEAVNAGPTHPLKNQLDAWRVRCMNAEQCARAALARITQEGVE